MKKVDHSFEKIQIIFEIANNHQGSITHFERIFDDIYKNIKDFDDFFEFKIKFQFRNLETFIDKTINPNSNKHISRFTSTELDDNTWINIFNLVKKKGLKVMVTPFDEISVKKAIEFGIDEFKIASCSSTEWSLLKEVIKSNKNVTISTGGRNLTEIDNIYSHLAAQIPNKFTIMHCCGIYPAPINNLNLQTIKKFITRYPLAKIGYSGHENPHNHHISSLALALGATSLERHIGKEDKEKNINLNAYSVGSENIKEWLSELKNTIISLGNSKDYNYFNETENESLQSLQRGAFAINPISAGNVVKPSNCNFKFPIQENQVSAARIHSIDIEYKAKVDIKAGERITKEKIFEKLNPKVLLKDYVHRIRGIINEYGEFVPHNAPLEISHHYGLKDIQNYGCCLITIVNRSYCKKLIVMTKGQMHPMQHHKVKEETFRVLHGKITLQLDNKKSRQLEMGDEALVEVGVKHSFKALSDCIIEEISTKSTSDDSYYEDQKINKMNREERKSFLNLHFS